MRHVARRILLIGLVLGLVVGVAAVSAANNGNGRSYSATLSGDGEEPSVDTDATGKATFQAAKNGTVLNYQLRVKDIDGVVAAHIHLGLPTENGPVVVTLFAGNASGNGSLAKGTLTDADVNGAGLDTIAELIAEIENGNTYVNVHTLSNLPGEIRGQID